MALVDSEHPDVVLLEYRLCGGVVTPLADLLNRLAIPVVMATANQVEKLGDDSPFSGTENVGKPLSQRSSSQPWSVPWCGEAVRTDEPRQVRLWNPWGRQVFGFRVGSIRTNSPQQD